MAVWKECDPGFPASCLSSNVMVPCAAPTRTREIASWLSLGQNPGAHVGVAPSRSPSDHMGTQRASHKCIVQRE
jgi:hypothetical protein